MGIKNFYTWFRNNEIFKNTVSTYNKNPVHTDHILIDMNGIIHEAAQKIYKYGKYDNTQQKSIKIPKRFLKNCIDVGVHTKTHENLEILLFENIKNQVNKILEIVIPNRTVFLAIDGVAPRSKQNQQRQRRFRAAQENTQLQTFDSACITAGTEFMQRLSDYISDCSWLHVSPEVDYIFSNHNIPGEGEHKLIEWIKNYQYEPTTFTVVGLDADLILLCLCLEKKDIHILRENQYTGYDLIDINKARQNLNKKNIQVSDILVWSCFLGNDFLPPIPSLEIKESFPEKGAIDWFFDNYERPLIIKDKNTLDFNEIKRLLMLHSSREQDIMEARFLEESVSRTKDREGKPVTRFPNTLWKGDIKKYRHDYFTTKIVLPSNSNSGEIQKEKTVSLYLQTVYWVYLYYTKTTKKIDWGWFYPYNYTLHAADFVEHIDDNYEFIFDLSAEPCHHHEQLLRVIHPKSKNILPDFLRDKLENINKNYIYSVDYEGKRFDWEGITNIYINDDK